MFRIIVALLLYAGLAVPFSIDARAAKRCGILPPPQTTTFPGYDSVITPDESTPVSWARFSGVWAYGAVDGKQCITMVVQVIFDNGTASVWEIAEPYAPWDSRGGYQFKLATFRDNVLEYEFDYLWKGKKETKKYSLTLTGTVLVVKMYWPSTGFSRTTRFAKRPEDAPWNKPPARPEPDHARPFGSGPDR